MVFFVFDNQQMQESPTLPRNLLHDTGNNSKYLHFALMLINLNIFI